MVNYALSKIISFGPENHKINAPNTFILASTQPTAAACLADIKRNYKSFVNGAAAPVRFYYNMIENIGVDNLHAVTLEEHPCKDKAELNAFYESVVKQINQSVHKSIVDNKTQISDITSRRYQNNIQVLMRNIAGGGNPRFYVQTDVVIKYIRHDSRRALETQKNYFKALLAYISDREMEFKTVYRKELNELCRLAEIQRDKNELSPNETKKWIDHDTVLQLVENQLRQQVLLDQHYTEEYVVSLFYSGLYFAPYRLLELTELKMDVANSEFILDMDADNYVNTTENTIVLNIYKTSGYYGKIQQPISPEFKNILVSFYLQNYKESPYLFSDQYGRKWNVAQLNKKLENIFGCSCNLLRRSYISHLDETGQLRTNEQMKAAAREMRDSLEVMLSYRYIKESL